MAKQSVYQRAMDDFTRFEAIPSWGATLYPERYDYLGVGDPTSLVSQGDPTRSKHIGIFAKDFQQNYTPEDPAGAPFPLNSPLEEDPITVLRRNTDRARNYPRTFSEMFTPSLNPEGDIGRFIRPKPPGTRPGMVIPQSLPMSAVQAKSAVPAPGLLDTEDEQPADSKSWYDDPMSMGLIQAGLGLMSAPRYSTNPNDVTLSSALARGLGGFIQGYGGTKKRLDETERQRIEDERDARKEEYDIMYLRALTTDAISRAQQTNATMTEKAEARRLARELKESQVSQILGKQTNLNQTQRVERRKQLMGMSPEMLQSEYLQFFPTAEMQETQNLREKLATYTGQPAETYAAYESKDLISAISKFEEPKKPETKELGEADERMFNSLNKGKRGDIPLGDPEYVNAYTRYYEKYLRPKTYPDGSSYLPSSQFDAPPDFKTAAVMGEGDLISKVNTAGGSLIKRMDQKDKDAVRNLTSNIAQLEEYENILSKIDINNLDRISQTSPEIADLQTLFKNLQLRLKDNPYGLGALTGPDLGLMEAILSDPTKADITDWRAYLQNRPFYLAQANRLKRILAQDADSIYSDYNTSVDQEFQKKYDRPLTWVPETSPKTSRLSPQTSTILEQIEEQPSADAPVPNNGNESSLLDYLPDRIRNIFN